MDEQTTEQNLAGKLADIERLLDEYESKLQLDKISIVKVNLSLTREVLLSMHPTDIDGYRWELAQYMLALQKEINRHSARLAWSEANLKRVLESEADSYPGFKWEEKQANALNSNSYAQKLYQLKVRSKAVVDRLAFIPTKIQFMENICKDIAYTKRHYDKREHNGD